MAKNKEVRQQSPAKSETDEAPKPVVLRPGTGLPYIDDERLGIH